MSDIERDPQSSAGEEGPLSRRRLVIGGIAAVGSAAVAASAFSRAANAMSAQELSDRVVSADPSLCVGCLACEVNCSTWHASVGRSAVARIRILVDKSAKLNSQLASYLPSRAGFSPQTCKQCYTPWCLPNCPTEGLQIDPKTGDRFIDETQCIACGKCEVDCPVEFKGTLAYKSQAISSKRVLYDPVKNV
jgi:Fe-S-cluster-containing dehydrogenase component